jgi:AcrR family transcriptional regulator
MATDAVPVGRRQRRRLETIEEVLDVAVAVMAEQGVAGLSVGEVARRMGIQPPSLYVYFPSKNALYDALFTRGAQQLLDQIRATDSFPDDPATPLETMLLDASRAFVRWAVEHAAYSQLLFWRPVPGFTPSPAAYAPAVQLIELVAERFAELQRRGLVRDDVTPDQVTRDWTVVISGVVSQQLSNAPGQGFDEGLFTSGLPRVAAMFAGYYRAPTAASTASTPSKRGRREDSS